MTIIGAMRVRNEERWIRRVLKSIMPLCLEVFVMDDASSDRTVHESKEAGANVITSPFNSAVMGIDEARDKNFLVKVVRNTVAAWHGLTDFWILMIDGDEELDLDGWDIANIKGLSVRTSNPAFTLRVGYLWNAEEQVRTDGVYANMTRPSLFHVSRTDCNFRNTEAGGNFHCGNVPFDLRGQSAPSNLCLKHYGYMNLDDRLRKYRFYNNVDPNNEREDRYQHMVIGDLFPPDHVAKHGGPLRLETWSEWKNKQR